MNKMKNSLKPGIYIHIPFCKSKCDYCDFYSITDLKYKDQFTSALIKEIDIYAEENIYQKHFDTIYIGGGTPSILLPYEIAKILEVVHKQFSICDDAEITLEINPGTATFNALKIFRSIGINRLSIGVQSFNDPELKFLRRIHNADQAEECILRAREIDYQNINLDLMFALPGQKIKNWEYSLRKAILFNPEHISTYNLSYEEGTPIYDSLINDQFRPLNECQELNFFEFTHKFLTEHDYYHYEVSNFAQSEDNISKHNYKYWNHIPFLGFGPSAHSFWENQRWGNVLSLDNYIDIINNGNKPIAFHENLDINNLIFEYIFLKLRTYTGLNLKNFHRYFGKDFVDYYKFVIKNLIYHDLAILDNEYFRLTQKGMLICDEIIPHFT